MLCIELMERNFLSKVSKGEFFAVRGLKRVADLAGTTSCISFRACPHTLLRERDWEIYGENQVSGRKPPPPGSDLLLTAKSFIMFHFFFRCSSGYIRMWKETECYAFFLSFFFFSLFLSC